MDEFAVFIVVFVVVFCLTFFGLRAIMNNSKPDTVRVIPGEGVECELDETSNEYIVNCSRKEQ